MDTISRFDGRYFFLSNFSPSPNTPPTLEHHYQASKFVDYPNIRKMIMRVEKPGQAKNIAHKYRNLTRSDWTTINLDLMQRLLLKKFSEPDLEQKLSSTGDAQLVEGNYWHDNFWGCCTCGRCPEGKNHLGILLMEVRDKLQNKE